MKKEEIINNFFGSEELWKYIFTLIIKRYFLKLFWNLFCLIILLYYVIQNNIYLFHSYMIKMWIFSSATCIIKLFYFIYYFHNERDFSHTPWSLGRLYSIRQVWCAAGIALLLFRGSILIDILLHVESRTQSPLIVLVDITQFLFWTSILFPFPIIVGFCLIEANIQLVRLWGSPLDLNWKLSTLCTIIIFIYCLTAIFISRSVLLTIQKSYNALEGIQSISQTKLRMVHLLCSVILTPIHTIVESIRNIDNNFMLFKHWNNRIVCATNQVILYSNNFLMLVRIEEGRFQFEYTNMMHIPTIVESVINRLPVLGDSMSTNLQANNISPIVYSSASDRTVVLSDSKALTFILENTLTYCLNVTRRKAVELKGRLRRQIQFHEFQPIDISMKIIDRNEVKKNEPTHFMQFIITFGVLSSSTTSTTSYSSSLPSTSITREMIFTAVHSITSEYDVCIQSALDEIKQPRYLQEMLNTTDFHDNSLGSATAAETSSSSSSSNQKQTRQSTILMTAKQMLDSCGGSLRLLEIKSSNSLDIKSSGDVNIIILNVPCHLRDDLAPMKDLNSGVIRFEQVRGNFDFGILVTDNELSEYAQRMFLQCNVKCCRITNNSRIPLNNYSAIITDSLATYADIRVRGFRGKVVVMSAAAIYIDGNSTHRSCDYVLPVPCELSDVQGLVQSIYNENFRPSVSLPSLYAFVKIEEKLKSYSYIPFIYFICELITAIKALFVSLAEIFEELVQWLKMRAQSRLDKERERNEIYQLGRQYDFTVNFFQIIFRQDIENDYLKWRMFHTPPFWNNSTYNENQRDYAPSSIKTMEGQYITPSSLIFIFIHFILVLFMIVIHLNDIYPIVPLIALIPLIGTIHFYNFKNFRKSKLSHNYWNIIQLLVIFIYLVTMILFLLGPNPKVTSSQRKHFHEIIHIQVGKFKLGQIICFAIFAPLASKTVSLLSFSKHTFVKNCIAIVTIVAIGLCIPKLFKEDESTLAYITLLPAFPFLHLKSISQFWMRKWYQNTQKHHFSQEFITKCTEIVWKELRYPLKTLIDYHEEYLQFALQSINKSHMNLTPTLIQHLTTYRLGNLLLIEIQTILKLKEILDCGRSYTTENKSKCSMNLRNELINIGRVFESVTPITIKVYFRMEQSIPCYVSIDKDLLIAVLVNTLSQSVACIKSKVNSESRAISFVYEIVITLSTYINDGKLFLKFQAMDSGSALPTTENENTIFQEDLCRQCILALGGTFDREVCSHSFYRNIVSFSFPIQQVQPLNWKGNFHESGYKHNFILEKYLARNTNLSANTSRYQSVLGKHILIIAQKENLPIISRIFRMQKWECMEAESKSHLSYYLLNQSDIDIDAILIDRQFNQFEAFGDEDIVSIAIKLRSVFEGVCLVGLVNHKSDMNLSDGYDVIITRPIIDSELKNIMTVCDTISLKHLLWSN